MNKPSASWTPGLAAESNFVFCWKSLSKSSCGFHGQHGNLRRQRWVMLCIYYIGVLVFRMKHLFVHIPAEHSLDRITDLYWTILFVIYPTVIVFPVFLVPSFCTFGLARFFLFSCHFSFIFYRQLHCFRYTSSLSLCWELTSALLYSRESLLSGTFFPFYTADVFESEE